MSTGGRDLPALADLVERLEEIAGVEGVTAVALVDTAGDVLAATGDARDVLAELIGSTLGASRALGELFGDGAVRQAVIEYRDGPVVLVPLDGARGWAAVVALSSLGALGRVRFQLRRSLPGVETTVERLLVREEAEP